MSTRSNAPVVYLLRSASESDPYVQALAEVGLTARCVPVLQFAFPNPSELTRRIRHPEQYGGLIATSPRAGRALAKATSDQSVLRDAWRVKPAYAVGPKTASVLRGIGLSPQGEDGGDAEALVSIIAQKEHEKPLLFLAGNRRRDTLPRGLQSAGIAFEELTVYVTQTRGDVEIPAGSRRDWLVFFSPSGIEAIQQSPGVDPGAFRVAAIGPTTASALRENGFEVEAVAETPSPDALSAAIARAVDAEEAD